MILYKEIEINHIVQQVLTMQPLPKCVPKKRTEIWTCQEKRCLAAPVSNAVNGPGKFDDLGMCHTTCEQPFQTPIVWSAINSTSVNPVPIQSPIIFTDIKGSSTLWRNNSDAMFKALEK
jgi:hypothetical protein